MGEREQVSLSPVVSWRPVYQIGFRANVDRSESDSQAPGMAARSGRCITGYVLEVPYMQL